MNKNEELHKSIIERIEYLTDNGRDLDQDDKITQLTMIFDGMRQQRDQDLLAEEIFVLVYYSYSDPEATLHVNIMFPNKNRKD